MENKISKIQPDALAVVIKNAGLDIQQGEEIKSAYISFLNDLAIIQVESSKIDFNNPTSTDEKISRDLRLRTVKVRINANDMKDSRKKTYLLKGNLEQAAYNMIAASCKLTEDTFLQVEKSREIAEKARLQERYQTRLQELAQLHFDATFTDILNMPDPMFLELVLRLENEKTIRIAAELQAEKERLEKIESEKVRVEKLRFENLKLLAEKEKAAKELEVERKKQAEILAKQKAESEKLAKIEAEKQAKIQAEILAKAAIEKAKSDAFLKAQKEANDKLKAKIAQSEKEKDEKEKAEKAARNAPDRDKLIALAKKIESIEVPYLTGDEANKIIDNIRILKVKLVNFIIEKTGTM